jgi:hypothetical protein
MPVNFFSGFFGIKLQKKSRFYRSPQAGQDSSDALK